MIVKRSPQHHLPKHILKTLHRLPQGIHSISFEVASDFNKAVGCKHIGWAEYFRQLAPKG